MVIRIDDNEFGYKNFEYEIYVNDEKRVEKADLNEEVIIDAEADDIILIRAKNIVLSSNLGWLWMFAYWFFSLLGGYGEENPFGKPFDAYIQFKSSSTYIKLKANKLCEASAFSISHGELDIQRNEFVSTKKYVVRWCLGYALPINILICAIIGLLLLVGVPIEILIIILVLALIGVNIHIINILKSIKI